LTVELHRLDNVKCPRDKLEVLLAAHKILVDGLTFPPDDAVPRSFSADLLLPILIYRFLPLLSSSCYSIVHANLDTLISNIEFIQRFRADSLLQGEASYCLTNLVSPSAVTRIDI
jgi:phosphopantothenoylcysteine decarboxylase